MGGMVEGRVCIVTGAGRGLGREYALMLAEQGAKVVVNDYGGSRDYSEGGTSGPADEVVQLIKDRGGEAVANYEDVSDWAAAERMVAAAVNTFGKLDVLVNNAGILRDRMLVNMSEEEWDAVIKVHLKGTAGPSHFAAVHWRDRSKAGEELDACLINTTSVSGIYGNAGQTNYGAAKAGIAAFTFIAGLELARYGVRVNCIAPGALTRLTEDLRPRPPTDEEREASSPRWVAPLCVWLASPRSAGITGRVFEGSPGLLAVAEGWHRGPSAKPVQDPELVDEIMRSLLADARPPADMSGRDRPA